VSDLSSITRERKSHIWARDQYDFYVEPESCTAALLKVEAFYGTVFDPCCGSGNIVRAFIRSGHRSVVGNDIVNRVGDLFWFGREIDYLSDDFQVIGDCTVMNPPYYRAKGTEAFIRKALKLSREKVAAFVDLRFLTGARRANGLFKEHPPSRIYVLSPRPSCPPGSYLEAGNKAGGGTSDWAWLVWQIGTEKPTEFAWLTL